MKKIIVVGMFLLLSLIYLSCERDDICVDAPITPFLIITFQNNDPNIAELRKPVQDLQVELTENNQPVYEVPISGDSIAIPLNVAAEKVTFKFTRNVGNLNESIITSDDIEFTYTTNQEFVNRACGFRTTYSNLNAVGTSSNWIKNIITVNPEINDQNNIHINLFH